MHKKSCSSNKILILGNFRLINKKSFHQQRQKNNAVSDHESGEDKKDPEYKHEGAQRKQIVGVQNRKPQKSDNETGGG